MSFLDSSIHKTMSDSHSSSEVGDSTTRAITSEELKRLSDKSLHNNLIQLKSRESKIVALIVSHLNEVYRRRLYADFGCSSIYDYCIKILKYSNGEAHRKISACKLMSQVPEVGESIAKGELSLSNAASVQTLISKIQKSQKNSVSLKPDEKTSPLKSDIIQKIIGKAKNKSSRECERELYELAKKFQINDEAPEPFRKNINDLAQLKICVNREDLDLLKKELGFSCEQELIQNLVKEKLIQLGDQKTAKMSIEIKSRKPQSVSKFIAKPYLESGLKPQSQCRTKPRSISPSKRSIVFKKAGGKCENCGASQKLEIDHKLSVARGGGNEIENLRLLCKPCNQRAAIRQLGLEKMELYLSR